MDKYIYDENKVFGRRCKTNIICRALLYRPKEKSLSGYGDSGTNAA